MTDDFGSCSRYICLLQESTQRVFSKRNKLQSCNQLNIAGVEAIEVFNTFTFANNDDKDDPEAILCLAKFQNYCEPKKNITHERHIFNT